ncbi:short chain dehydrogenase/reductase family protein [Penicillium chermesinum]|uniref:Short-chain dehydrogenase/reductase 3 n=1 Tax=Penicillium chermesinum TaxID=63820 RepID=A0A9W9TN71_9EURO|nr:short chain dehydrogenase/reductase family protein [Penicillium chermesinum]KAJ5232716.1 short chain dehydrogenase/reductase family protein [Penicillium chermesinum]KAJ6172377.1 short chain dehydrogenase/reductase family protein [Penicillium chermesinum]
MASQGRKWLSREGFTSDVLRRWIHGTILSPWKMIPLLALVQYSGKGRKILKSRPNLLKALQALTSLAVLGRLGRWLDRRSVNNGTSDYYDWHREVIVLTGGSGGIGRHIAQLFGDHGIKVAILDLNPPADALPNSVRFFQCDITSVEAIKDAGDAIRTSLGRPTILVNNAGVLTGKTILGATPAQTRLIFEVNTLAHYWLVQEFLPDMISNNHGMVVTVASQAGYAVAPNMVDYSASKAAAIAFHEGLAAELVTRYQAPRVRTVLVTQGFTRTSLIDKLTPEDSFLNPLLYPETVAEGLVNQVLKGESGHVLVPRVAGALAQQLRGLPQWFQHSLRCQLERLMRAD